PQTDRSRRRPAAHSAACRTDAPAILAALRSPPTSTLAHSVGIQSPCATVYSKQSMLAILRIFADFHHGLLGGAMDSECATTKEEIRTSLAHRNGFLCVVAERGST